MTAPASVGLESLARLLNRPGAFESLPDGDEQDRALRAQVMDARLKLANLNGPDAPMSGMDDRMVSLLQCWLGAAGTEHGARLEPAGEGYEAKFDNLDPGWLWGFRKWIFRGPPHPFIAPGPVHDIANDWRIAVVGDWGSGLYGAPVIGRAIAQAAARQTLQMVLHLGDIYYAGDAPEVRERFLAHWPDVAGALHRALNGNHEMYLDGRGYFGTLLRDPRFAQESSVFALRNADWLLVGLDTAYDDHDLHGDQAGWVKALADAHPAHRIMLFSHHQPFSAFEKQGQKLQKRLMPLLAAGRVSAWYWGHEHLCARYDLHEGWNLHGRCVGHGGFPYFRFLDNCQPNQTRWERFTGPEWVPGGVILDGPNVYLPGNELQYGPHGWLTIELRGRAVHETWHDADGAVLDESDIPSDK